MVSVGGSVVGVAVVAGAVVAGSTLTGVSETASLTVEVVSLLVTSVGASLAHDARRKRPKAEARSLVNEAMIQVSAMSAVSVMGTAPGISISDFIKRHRSESNIGRGGPLGLRVYG